MGATGNDNPAKAQARALGLKRYFDGSACPRGHVAERYVGNSNCVVCLRGRVIDWVTVNAEKAKYQPGRYPHTEKRRMQGRKYRGLPNPTRPETKLCECCKKPPGKRGLHLDHDHVTGRFRGWLCHKCNNSIGMLGDNIGGVKAAIEYLRRAWAHSQQDRDVQGAVA